MFKNYLISFKVKNAYTVNQFIYSLQRLPLIGKIISSKLYGEEALKILNVFVTLIREFVKVFVYKFLYILFFITLFSGMYEGVSEVIVIHIYLFLSLIGSFSNTEIFNPTRDKYYMIVLMKMDARMHTLSNFCYFLVTTFIGQVTALLLLTDVHWYYIIAMVAAMIMIKCIAIEFYLYRIDKTNKVINENKPSWGIYFGLIFVLLGCAYGLPLLNLTIPMTYMIVLWGIVLVLGFFSLKKIWNYKRYDYIYKRLLTQDNIFANKNNQVEATTQASRKQIVVDKNITSDKSGFAYFHDLFVKRHKKILKDSAIHTAIVIFFLAIAVGIAMQLIPELKIPVANFALNNLPILLFVMYFINTGKSVTNAMFMNCDHSMLMYRFYRQPKTLLSLFRERLKTIILLNLIPTFTLSLSLCVLLFLTGQNDNILSYLIIFFSILAMSIFFSVHNLVLYYLLQPYNVGMEMKSTTYTIVSLITYWGCYYLMELDVSSLIFGSIMIVFAIAYSVISLFLVYRYAPKTFKLR